MTIAAIVLSPRNLYRCTRDEITSYLWRAGLLCLGPASPVSAVLTWVAE